MLLLDKQLFSRLGSFGGGTTTRGGMFLGGGGGSGIEGLLVRMALVLFSWIELEYGDLSPTAMESCVREKLSKLSLWLMSLLISSLLPSRSRDFFFRLRW